MVMEKKRRTISRRKQILWYYYEIGWFIDWLVIFIFLVYRGVLQKERREVRHSNFKPTGTGRQSKAVVYLEVIIKEATRESTCDKNIWVIWEPIRK